MYPCSAQRCQLLYDRLALERLVESYLNAANLVYCPDVAEVAGKVLMSKIKVLQRRGFVTSSEAAQMHKRRIAANPAAHTKPQALGTAAAVNVADVLGRSQSSRASPQWAWVLGSRHYAEWAWA